MAAEWVTELIRQVDKSKASACAVFVAAACVLYVPSRVASIHPAPPPWDTVAFAALCFTGFLIAYWISRGVFHVLTNTIRFIFSFLYSCRVSENEGNFLRMLGELKDHSVNVDDFAYGSSNFSRLEIGEMVDGLASKGLVERNPMYPPLVSLTDTGKKRALSITRKAKASGH